jgi:hypothetical protein
MANSNLTATIVVNEALDILHNNCVIIGKVDRQYDGENEYHGLKHGGSIKIRLPNQYTVRTGATMNVQDNQEQSVTLTIATQTGVDLPAFTTKELAQDIDTFSKRILLPAVNRLASDIDLKVHQAVYPGFFNSVGTPGTTPASALVYLEAGQKLDESAAPDDPRCLIINPAAQAATVNALTGLFNSSGKISKQYEKGMMGMDTLGWDWYMSQNVANHTTGSRAGTILIDGTVSTEGSTTIHVDGLSGATQTFKAGDIFTVGSVYGVNPETKQTNADLQQFTVTADATAAGSEVDLTVSPPMYTSASGGLQTIDAFPQDGAAVTVLGTASTIYPQNLAFHRDAITFASAPLRMPKGIDFGARQTMDNVSMRIVSDYDIVNDVFLTRMDIIWGTLVQRRELGCRIWG